MFYGVGAGAGEAEAEVGVLVAEGAAVDDDDIVGDGFLHEPRAGEAEGGRRLGACWEGAKIRSIPQNKTIVYFCILYLT